jgi:hypothetical protein
LSLNFTFKSSEIDYSLVFKHLRGLEIMRDKVGKLVRISGMHLYLRLKETLEFMQLEYLVPKIISPEILQWDTNI